MGTAKPRAPKSCNSYRGAKTSDSAQTGKLSLCSNRTENRLACAHGLCYRLTLENAQVRDCHVKARLPRRWNNDDVAPPFAFAEDAPARLHRGALPVQNGG